MELFNFHYAMVLAKLLYNVEMEPEDFEEIGILEYNRIGNLRGKLHKSCVKVNEDNTAILPENCDEIEAVTYDFEDARFTHPLHDYGDVDSVVTEEWIERNKQYTDPFYISGRYVKYTQNGNTLYLKDDIHGRTINVLYWEQDKDDEGLPRITEKEAQAIAAYVASVEYFKRGLSTNNQGLLQMSQLLQKKAALYTDQARIPDHLSQNEMNEVLDAHTSYDRKVYGKSYKPLK